MASQLFGGELGAVDRDDRAAVVPLQADGQAAACFAVRVHAVEQDQVRLADVVQLGDDALLGVQIAFPRDLGDAAVGGDHQAHGGVFPDDLAGAGLGSQVKGHSVVEPGAFDQARGVVLLVAERPVHHITHAVHQPGAETAPARKLHIHRLFGDKFRLGGHNGAAGRRLGQLVGGAGPLGVVFDVGQKHQLGKPFDQGAFSGAHRSHHADIDITAGALGNVLVNLFLRHFGSPFHSAAGISRQVFSVVISCTATPGSGSRWLAAARSLARAW